MRIPPTIFETWQVFVQVKIRIVESSNVVLQNVNRTISHLNSKYQILTPPEHQLRTQLDGRDGLPLRGLEMFVIGCYI